MPNYCPACGATQHVVVTAARGYARPLSDGDRRRKRRSRRPPRLSSAIPEPVGRITTQYQCDACDAVVVPGVSHVRNWNSPDNWLPVREWEKQYPISWLGPRRAWAGEEREQMQRLAARRRRQRYRQCAAWRERRKAEDREAWHRRAAESNKKRRERWLAVKDEHNAARRRRNRRARRKK